MKNLKYILVIPFLTAVSSMSGQIKVNQTVSQSAIPNSSAFIDASATATVNSTNFGKGLIFPRTDLSTMVLVHQGTLYNGASNPNRFDGMIVYNTKIGGAAVSGAATQGVLAEGFWYYDNKSGAVNGGTWRPFVPAAIVKSKEVVVTVAANTASSILDLGTTVITANEVGTFLGAKIYKAGALVMTADSSYDKATNKLNTGNGFISQVLSEGTYTVVVDYK